MSTPASEIRACAFCGRAVTHFIDVPQHGARSCLTCATRLGRVLVEAPLSFAAIWPILIEEDEDEPEPKVRLPDGRMVELREHTAELKKELTAEQRMELAGTYAQIGLYREQLLECGFVLSSEPAPELAGSALRMLLGARFTAPDALRRLREVLFPG